MDVTPYLDVTTAPRALFERAAAHPDRARYWVGAPGAWTAVTWADHTQQVRQAAIALLDAGLLPGDRVLVYSTNCVEWMAAALAVQAAGGVMVPVYASSGAGQAAYIARHSGARFVFASGESILDRIAECPGDYDTVEAVIALGNRLPHDAALLARAWTWRSWLERGAAAWPLLEATLAERVDADLDAPTVMLYTSGTTGDPKGVPLTHRNMGSNTADWLRCMTPVLEPEMVDLLWLPFSHVFGYGEACLGNLLGWTTYMSDPGRVIADLPPVAPSVFMSVPAYWEKIARGATAESDAARRRQILAEATGGRLRLCLSGGAGLDVRIKELYANAGVVIIEGYGLTETSPTLTLNRPDDYRFDTVGRPLDSVELRVADDGEILARGPNVFAGYFQDEAATQAAFTSDGWFCTGDLGAFTADGFLQITGRKKEILVTAGGKNVSPAAIELQFADEPLIDHLVVYGDGKKYLVAGVWPNESTVAAWMDAQAIPPTQYEAALHEVLDARIRRVNERLASCETIKAFVVVDEPLSADNGMLTASLKLRRRAVYERFGARFESLYTQKRAVEPRAGRTA